MGRVLVLTVLGFGAIFGFASGVRHLTHGEYGWGPPWNRQARMDALAEACVRAARDVSAAGAPEPLRSGSAPTSAGTQLAP